MKNAGLLSLCLIVKNEERYVKKCVQSVQNIVSKIIIVDTGSTDNTIEIAKTLTPHLYFFPFTKDFSQARNHALRFVDTPWILFLDADEELEPIDAENLIECVQNAPHSISGYELTRYNFFGTGGWYTSKNLKVFRNKEEIYYEGSVSESVAQSIKNSGKKIGNMPILLNHFGHCRSRKERDRKANLYFSLMQKEIAKQPKNSRLMGYMGMILRTLGHFEEALKIATKGVTISPNSAHAHYCKAQVLRSMGEEREALSHYLRAKELNPDDLAITNMIGLMHMSLSHYKEAEAAFRETYNRNALLIHTHVNLGLLYQAKGDYLTALNHFEKVAKRNRGFLRDDFSTRLECDPYREFYYETLFKFCGLGYHIAYCKEKIRHQKYSDEPIYASS